MVGSTLGHYEILAPIGAGGMGHVYLARDSKLGREVALKVLPPSVARDPERLLRLQREARALAALDHPGIVTVFSVEEADGTHFLTMARVQGETLGAVIPPEGMPVERLLEVGAALADAVRAAHERGIVHRDLKPSNVMVDTEGRVRVLDFGLSRVLTTAPLASELPTETVAQEVTQRGAVLGTAPYMSPEQAQAREVGPASDIFSLGIVLYEMATGKRPFEGDSAAAVISSILRDEPMPLDRLRKDLPRELSRIIVRCLDKRPDGRYESAAELRDALEGLRREASSVEGGSTALDRPSPRTALRTLAGAAIVVAGVLGAILWMADRRSSGPSRPAEVQASARGIRSIAVLPLLNLSNDPEQVYFSDGMTEALINSLAGIGSLSVTSRTSSMRFRDSTLSLPEIARQLGVDAVIEGSVQREGGRVRITAQLIDADTDRQLWGQAFERELAGALQLQAEVAGSIAAAILARSSGAEVVSGPEPRKVDPATYEAYLRGRHFVDKGTPEGLAKGMAYFQQAIDLDPTEPLAHAGLATGNILLSHATGDAEYVRRAKAAARKALQLDPSNAEANAALAQVAMYFDWDWDAAEENFQRAIALNPSQAEVHIHYAFLHMLRGDFERGRAEVEQAGEFDPLSPSIAVFMAEFYWPLGRLDDAEQAALRSLELSPGFPHALAWLGQVYRARGRYDDALNYARAAAEGNPRWLPYLGTVLVDAGRAVEARDLLDELVATSEDRVLVELAYFQATYGDTSGAMASLERAYEVHEVYVPWIGSYFEPGALAEDPRFQELLRKLKIDFVRPQLLAAAKAE